MTIGVGEDITAADINSLAPIGSVMDFAGSVAPTGWVLCDGASLLRVGTYAGLFAVIGTTYGTADGTHFNVPDCKGKTIVGLNSAESEFDALGETGGEKTHTLTIAEMPAHTHNYYSGVMTGGDSGGRSVTDLNADPTSSTGGGGAHQNLQPYITMNKIIKY